MTKGGSIELLGYNKYHSDPVSLTVSQTAPGLEELVGWLPGSGPGLPPPNDQTAVQVTLAGHYSASDFAVSSDGTNEFITLLHHG